MLTFTVVLLLLLLSAAVYGADASYNYTITVDPQKVIPVLKMLEADRFSQKIIEYGSTAAVSTLGIGWFGMMFKGSKLVYGQLRSVGARTVTFLSGVAVKNLPTAKIEKGIGKGVLEAGKITGKAGKTAISKFWGGKGESSVSPLKISSPVDSFFKSGGVGAGRTVKTADLLSGKVGSSPIKKLSVGDREFIRGKDGEWLEKTPDGLSHRKVSEGELGTLLSSSYSPQTGEGVGGVKVEYADGTQAVLNKQGDMWKEKLSPDVLTSKEKIQHRLSKDEIALDLKKLSGEEAAKIVNSLPVGTKISLTGGVYRDKDGKQYYHKVAFKKLDDGKLKLYEDYGSAKKFSEIKDRFDRLNKSREFKRNKKVDREFFNSIFKIDNKE